MMLARLQVAGEQRGERILKCLNLLVKANWLVDNANNRWREQNPCLSCNVSFQEGEVFLNGSPPSRPGYIVRLDDAARELCSQVARRLLVFIERNADILDLSQLDAEIVRDLRDAARAERCVRECVAFCESCRALARPQVAGEQPVNNEVIYHGSHSGSLCDASGQKS